MVLCDDIVIVIVIVIKEHDGRRPGIPSAPVVMKHDNTRDHRDIAIALNIQHNPNSFTYHRLRILYLW